VGHAPGPATSRALPTPLISGPRGYLYGSSAPPRWTRCCKTARAPTDSTRRKSHVSTSCQRWALVDHGPRKKCRRTRRLRSGVKAFFAGPLSLMGVGASAPQPALGSSRGLLLTSNQYSTPYFSSDKPRWASTAAARGNNSLTVESGLHCSQLIDKSNFQSQFASRLVHLYLEPQHAWKAIVKSGIREGWGNSSVERSMFYCMYHNNSLPCLALQLSSKEDYGWQGSHYLWIVKIQTPLQTAKWQLEGCL
jgi:hypothetical protein